MIYYFYLLGIFFLIKIFFRKLKLPRDDDSAGASEFRGFHAENSLSSREISYSLELHLIYHSPTNAPRGNTGLVAHIQWVKFTNLVKRTIFSYKFKFIFFLALVEDFSSCSFLVYFSGCCFSAVYFCFLVVVFFSLLVTVVLN